MLYKLIRKFSKLSVIVFVVMGCTSMLWPEKFLNDAIIYSPQSISEIVNSENGSLQRAMQTPSAEDHENSVNGGTDQIKRIVRKDKKSIVIKRLVYIRIFKPLNVHMYIQ